MPAANVRLVVRRFGPAADPPSDAELVGAFATRRDHAAFAELLRRHGPTVFGACRRVLGDSHDAEDAFQAVFLVFARKADTIRPPGAVGGWLYGVAVRTANKAKVAAARRRRREMIAATPERDPASRERERPEHSPELAELRTALDAELARLPESLRTAVVLCDLQGKTRAEAAAELGCPEGTVAARLHRARKRLADALTRRGLALPVAGLIAVLAPASVSAALSQSALVVASGIAPSAVQALAREVIRSMTTTIHAIAIGVVALVAGGLVAASTLINGSPENPGVNTGSPAPTAVAEAAPVLPAPLAQPDHGSPVYSVSYSPDGKRFLSVGGGKAMVWDTDNRKKLFAFDAEFAAFSGDGKDLFALAGDEFRTVDAATGKTTERKARHQPKSVPGGRWAAFSDNAMMWVEFDGVRHHLQTELTDDLYDLADQKDHNPLGSTIVPVHGRGGAFSSDNKYFAGIHAATKDYKEIACLTVWRSGTGARVGTIFRGFDHPVHAFAWSPSGEEIAVAYADSVRVYDAGTLKEKRKFNESGGTAIAWSKDGKMLAVAVQETVGTTTSTSTGSSTDGNTTATTSSSSTDVTAMPVAVHIIDAETGKQLQKFDGFADNLPVISLAFRPDGKQLVCGAGFFPSDGPVSNLPKPAKDAKGLRVLTLDEPAKPAGGRWKESKVFDLTAWLAGSVAFDPEGKRFYVGGTGHLQAYDAATLKQLWSYQDSEQFIAVATSPDGKTLATTYPATGKWGVQFLDAATGKATEKVEEAGAPAGWPHPLAVACFPDEVVLGGGIEPVSRTRKVIFGNAREYIVKSGIDWEKASTIKASTVDANKEPSDKFAVPIAVSPDGKRVVVNGPLNKDTGKNVLWAWSAGSGAQNKLLEGHKAAVVSAVWVGKVIVTGDADGLVITWDGETFKEKSRVNLGGRVAALTLSRDGSHISAAVARPVGGAGQGAYAEEVFMWPAGAPPEKPEAISSNRAAGPFAGVASLAFAPDGKTLVSAFCNFKHLSGGRELIGYVRIFGIVPEKPKVEPKPAPAPAAAEKWTDTSTLTDHGSLVNGVAVAPDGKTFAAATDGGITCWDATTRKVLWRTKDTDAPYYALAYSGDSKTLFVAGKTDVVRLDAATGKASDLLGDAKGVPADNTRHVINEFRTRALAVSPDGKSLAGSNGHSNWLVEPENPDNHRGHTHVGGTPKDGELVRAGVAWSADGKRLAWIDPKYTRTVPSGLSKSDTHWPVRVWNISEAGPFGGLFGHDDPVTAIAWSKDGKLIASGDEKGLVIAWDAQTGKELWHKRLGDGGRVHALAISPEDNTIAVGVGLGARKSPERVVLLAAKDGGEVQHLVGAGSLPVASVAWSKDGKFLVTGCGAAGQVITETKPPVGEVVVWERKP